MTTETAAAATAATATDPKVNGTLDGVYIPHDPDSNDFSSMTIEGSDVTAAATITADPLTTDTDEETATDHTDTATTTTATGAATGTGEDAPVFTFDNKEFTAAEVVPETPRELELRLQLEALRQQVPAAQQPGASTELKEPDLYDSGIDGDPEKLAAAQRVYYRELGKREAQQEQQLAEQQAYRVHDQTVYQQNVRNYDARRLAVKASLPDIDAADSMLSETLPDSHQAAIMCAGLDNPEMVAYALYKSPELREKFMKERNPVRLGRMLQDISIKARLAPKVAADKPGKEPEVKGSQGITKGNGLSKEFEGATFE